MWEDRREDKRERESVVERESEKAKAQREAKAKARWEIRGTARDGAEIDSRSKGGLARGLDR